MSLLFGAQLLQAVSCGAGATRAATSETEMSSEKGGCRQNPARSLPSARAQGSPIGAGVSHIRQKAEAAGTCLSAAVEQERSRQREVGNGRATEAAERSEALSDSS